MYISLANINYENETKPNHLVFDRKRNRITQITFVIEIAKPLFKSLFSIYIKKWHNNYILFKLRKSEENEKSVFERYNTIVS